MGIPNGGEHDLERQATAAPGARRPVIAQDPLPPLASDDQRVPAGQRRPRRGTARTKTESTTHILPADYEQLRGLRKRCEFQAPIGARRSRPSAGACTAVRKIVVPVAWKTVSKERVMFDPRSRIKNRKFSNRSPRFIARLRACCTVQSPVGCGVTPPRCIRRVSCSMNIST